MIHTPASRAVYRHADLLRLVRPRSIAVIGASERVGAFGSRAMANLKGFQGDIWPVNARYQTIGGARCYAGLDDLPGIPDLAIIAVAQATVEDVVRECAAKGVGGAVIFASGYAETGQAELAAAQARLGEIARESGLRLLGPNCAGFVNFTTSVAAAFSTSMNLRWTGAPAVGLVSQSGALGFSLSQAVEHGASFSHVLTVGNSCDVDVADLVSFLADDPDCRAIACLYEGMADPKRLLDAATRARACGKPVIVFKLATGAEGAASALSHTGAMAGSAVVQRAAFERAGVVWTESWSEFVEFPAFFANAPEPRGGAGTAVLTTSGGAAIMATDVAERRGETLPQPTAHTLRLLADRIPEFAQAHNPCDITAQVLNDPECLRDCVEAMLSDDGFDALIVAQTRASAYVQDRVRMFGELGRKHGKPVCIVWLTQWLEGPGVEPAEDEPGLTVFRSMETCLAALAAWRQRAERIRRPPHLRLSSPDARDGAKAILQAGDNRVIGEYEAKRALSLYGIPVPWEALAGSADEAARIQSEIAAPVALKLISPDLPHKSDAGVIRLGLADEAAVREAYQAILAAAAAIRPTPAVEGVVVQAMAGRGVELVLGAHTDAQFGPVVMVGLGGVFVEALRDTVLAPAPIGREEARAMLESLQGRRLLDGFRGMPAVDLALVADLVTRFSEFVDDHRAIVAEIDVNPVICAREGMVAVDALIVRRA